MTPALGPHGVWGTFDHLPVESALDYALLAEQLGYDCFWINESFGREPFALLGALASATSKIMLGVGIASIYARDAVAAHAGARTIAELSHNRFILGLGVSHAGSVEARGHTYATPLRDLEQYLDRYGQAPYRAPRPEIEPPLVIAALGNRALDLGVRKADGVFPYLVTADYVRRARARIDTIAADAERHRPTLIVTLPVVAETDPDVARVAARAYLAGHLKHAAYRRNLTAVDFTEQDLDDGGSDHLVDRLVAWGGRSAIQARVAEMRAAGADHVAVIPLSPEGFRADRHGLEAAAPAS